MNTNAVKWQSPNNFKCPNPCLPSLYLKHFQTWGSLKTLKASNLLLHIAETRHTLSYKKDKFECLFMVEKKNVLETETASLTIRIIKTTNGELLTARL